MRKAWKQEDVVQLHDLIVQGYRYEEIAKVMNRGVTSIYCKATKIGYHKLSKYYNTKTFKKHIKPTTFARDTTKWRQHPRYKNYYISDTGRVWSALRARELKLYKLSHKSNQKKRFVGIYYSRW